MNPFIFLEAISSVAMEHPEGHDCRVCKAAKGDMQARIDLLIELELGPKSASDGETP